MIHRYTLFGNPVEHSLSPKIHQLFSEQVQRRVSYTTTLAEASDFASKLDEFQASGAQGCNVTLPFKQLAIQLCDKVDEAARIAGSVNTVKFLPDGSKNGFNTDGSGFITDLKENIGFDPTDKKILLIGAGGAARGIIHPLLAQGINSITLANRTLGNAEKLVDEFSQYGELSALALDSLLDRQDKPDIQRGFDLIINSTSAQHQGKGPTFRNDLLTPDTAVYDLSYSATGSTPFTSWASDAGCQQAHHGIGMLLEQAADAFFIWEDVRPKTRLVGHQLL